MNCYLLLYGIGRDQKNLKSNISFFKKIHPKIKVIYHYLKVEEINNMRSKEKGRISYKNIEDICEDTLNIEIDEIKKNKILNYSKNFEDGHRDGYRSNSNLINQLLILKTLSDKIKNINIDDTVIVYRDDVKFDMFSKFLFKLYWSKIKKSSYVFISAFSWHGGFNDKFFITNKKNAEILLNRIDFALESIDFYKHLNAEELLLFISKKFKLKIYPIFCRVGRVRINGIIKWDPFFPSLTRLNDLKRVIKSL